MKKILIITGRYLPGYKDGGPVRTIKNLVDNLGDEYTFYVMCADRDHGDLKPYDGIRVNSLNQVGKALVFYSKDGKFGFKYIKKLCKECDLVYVCGPYNNYSIKALLLKRLRFIKAPLIMAPMGSFSKGALKIGAAKKHMFFKICKVLGLYKGIYFSVTSEYEEKELKEELNIDNKCYIAEDMPRCIPDDTKVKKTYDSSKMQTNIIFLSRICEKKNLSYAIDILSGVKEKAIFHIYGNIEDKAYYDMCLEKLEKNLPENISWEYMGEVASEDVPEVFAKYDVFLFPTAGENFGHVISEALSAGCIPVISDTTPWRDLDEKDCGYVIQLSDTQRFIDAITQICKMTPSKLVEKSENAKKYFVEKYEKSLKAAGNGDYREMFDELLR